MDNTYIVTARKWRPVRFNEIVGQDHISTTLKNAIELKRVHHAYIFTGPRGVGKTTSARVLAKALNCLNPQKDAEPCGECSSCTSITIGNSMDVIEIDGASNNGVDDIRKLRENSKYPPVNSKYKVYIIDEVHMLSTSAFNALLKTLEEPPPHLLFIFATTEIQKVPATIVSRCQRFDFRRMDIKSIVSQLQYIAEQEQITIDEQTLLLIAKQADGSMRDSQSIFDKVIAFCGKSIAIGEARNALSVIDDDLFFDITTAIFFKDSNKMFEIVSVITSGGFSVHESFHGLIEHFRNILMVQSTGKTELLDVAENYKQLYSEEAKRFSNADILRYVSIVQTSEQLLRTSTQHTIRLELALVEMTQIGRVYEINELISIVKNNLLTLHDEVTQVNQSIIEETKPNYSRSSLKIETQEKYVTTKTEVINAPLKSEVVKEQTVEIVQEVILQKNVEELKNPNILSLTTIEQHWKEVLSSKDDLFVILRTLLLNKKPGFEIVGNSVTILCDSETILNEITKLKKVIQQNIRMISGNEHLIFKCSISDSNLLSDLNDTTSIDSEQNIASKKLYESLSDSKKNILSEMEDILTNVFNARIVL